MKNLITCLVVSVLSGVTFADTWTVDDDGKADFDNIQAAVDAASDGDEIVVMPGTYTSTQDGHVVNMLGKAVTLRSNDPTDPDVVAATIIDGEGARRGLACFNEETNKTVIAGFTISNGYSVNFDYGGGPPDSGGGMHCINSNPTLNRCTFQDNFSDWGGGGIYNLHSQLTLVSCLFVSNSAHQGGAFYGYMDESSFVDCEFINNYCSENGAALRLYFSTPTTLENCTITNNVAGNFCGGVYSVGTFPSISDSIICGNTPDQIVGGYIDDGGNTIADSCEPTAGVCCSNDLCVDTEEELCNTFGGQWLGVGTLCSENPCPVHCAEDVTGDGVVDVSDLLAIIAVWGTCP